MWYRSLRPNESTSEWSKDEISGQWWVNFWLSHRYFTHLRLYRRGLPTRSRIVAEFMVGLEKTKAKAGEISQSARALNQEDFHRMHDLCLDPGLSLAEKKQGTVRYVSSVYLFLCFTHFLIEIPGSLSVSVLDDASYRRSGSPHIWQYWQDPSRAWVVFVQADIMNFWTW